MVSHRLLFAVAAIPKAGCPAHLVPKIFHWSNGFSSTPVRYCGYPGGWVTSTSRAKNISLVQWFLIGWRTRLPPRLCWLRVGSGRIGLRLPMHCSNRRSYSLISLQVAPAPMVPALSGIRPVAYPSTSMPPGPAGFRCERAFFRHNPAKVVGWTLLEIEPSEGAVAPSSFYRQNPDRATRLIMPFPPARTAKCALNSPR
jgi:hypothetical protein